MAVNYQKALDETLSTLGGNVPALLLHSCCAPCSSYVLEYLTKYFNVTLYYYNPNIFPAEEYYKRLNEQQRLLGLIGTTNPVYIIPAEYEPQRFYDVAAGLGNEPEGGSRCELCFRLRLEETAKAAKAGGFDYFTTTLSVSPHKSASLLNKIGKEMSEKYGVPYLYSDFKKREGYKRSIELSNLYGLYRQNYCGCEYSLGKP